MKKIPSKNQQAVSAWGKWARVLDQPTNIKSMYRFTEFLGHPHKDGCRYVIDIDNPEVMKKVELILGPNGHTLLKMWAIQRHPK